jgi:sugar (pentulose or hexulose) kinase
MPLVAGLDFGGGAVKACVADVERGEVLGSAAAPTATTHPAPGRVEFEPDAWWAAAATAMRGALGDLKRPLDELVAITATSLRQGYVLLDGSRELGPGVVNADRRGESQMERTREVAGGGERLYQTTGHWPAPQLTLPKLLQEQAESPERWDRVEHVLFVHDWALWRLCGVRVSEPSLASAGQLLDVRRRTWASELIAAAGLDPAILPPLADPGTIVGELRDETLGLPRGVPVVVGGGDTQVAAAGVGGLHDGVVTVVAGTTTPVQASSASAPDDPLRRPWVSAHLAPDRWAVETNAGYTGLSFDWLAGITGRSVPELADEAAGSAPGANGVTAVVTARTWSEDTWSNGAPTALFGFEPRHTRADVARAFLEAHAYAIRGNLEDLERVLGAPARDVRLTGGASRSTAFCQLVADVIGRPLTRAAGAYPAGRAFAWLAARAAGGAAAAPTGQGDRVEPRARGAYDAGYRRFAAAGDTVERELPGWPA